MPQGQLTTDERYITPHMQQAGFKKAAIARRLRDPELPAKYHPFGWN